MSRPTWDTDRPDGGFRLRGFHPLWPLFPEGSAIHARATSRSRNPGRQAFRFGLLRVRSPLLAQSRLLSSPSGTEMFHFPECRSSGTIFVHPAAASLSERRVSPFGNLRIKALWRLPEAYRSLMRPSSPHDAKASVVRPYTLSKKSRYLVTLQFSLTSSLRLSKTERKTVLRPRRGWWRQPDSNRRHPACKAGTLPAELCPPSNGQATAEREWLSGDGDSATAHPPPPAACSLHWWA